MNRAFLVAYNCLDKIYREGAYCEIALDEQLKLSPTVQKSLVTKLVYGVLDNCLKIDYIISQFASSVKPAVKTYLRIGIYCLQELSIPKYAVVNDCTELAKTCGKIHTVGFVNATMRAISRALDAGDIKYPKDKLTYLSIFYSFPLWAVKKLASQYGYDTVVKLLSYKFTKGAHIRINTRYTTKQEFCDTLDQQGLIWSDSILPDCLYVTGSLIGLPSRLYTNMSLGSCMVARAVCCQEDAKVLDLCSAPGGKAIYIAHLTSASVTACDIHAHRIDLVKSYASRMGVTVDTRVCDATKEQSEFIDSFDYCICDVPCSNLGVFYTKPDVRLNKQEDMTQLGITQRAILANAAKYVKRGGVIVYSTCSLLRCENEDVVEDFLSSHPCFEGYSLPANYGGTYTKQFLPHIDGVEGFFLATLKRTE